jgi:quinoprotein glucose dehydrogenase
LIFRAINRYMKRCVAPNFIVLIALFFILSCKNKTSEQDYTQWSEYLGGPERNHYSSLTQINTSNVAGLKKAWEYKSGDSGQVQCNPIVVNGILFGVTASNHVFALNAATGVEMWTYVQPGAASTNVNRGVSYWEKNGDKRILCGYNGFLYALNAETGKPIKSFGLQGKIDLKTGLEPNAKDRFIASTTPGTLFEDLIIMPLRVGEEEDAAIGYIQAFNVRTGKLVWVFKTMPDKGQPGSETWPSTVKEKGNVGGVNNWAGMAVDKDREMIFIPTGSPAFDFYGGNRPGNNLYANSLIALNVRTGKYIWHYQMVHHDIWDKDLPAPPNLVKVKHEGKEVDAVAQVTKHGYVFLFDRETGKPLFPIKEQPFPASDVPGEVTSATQPIPVLPLPYARQRVEAKDISTLAENHQELMEVYRKSNKGLFRPLGLTPTIMLPGADGGAEWGGAAADPEGILYVNSNEMPWLFSLSKSEKADGPSNLSSGHLLFNANCVTCHGASLKGNPASGYPSLVDIKHRVDRKTISRLISTGRGMMPGFTHISATEKQAIIDFLYKEEKTEAPSLMAKNNAQQASAPYKFNGYNKFLDVNGYAGINPPWGTLTAIDLNTGKHLWQITLGEFAALTAKGIPPTGTENYGGPVVTAGNLLFIAATKDGMFRAFDRRNGKLLWKTTLPAGGFATPSTYEVNGKQYVVIACGGDKLGLKKGDSYVAFAL